MPIWWSSHWCDPRTVWGAQMPSHSMDSMSCKIECTLALKTVGSCWSTNSSSLPCVSKLVKLHDELQVYDKEVPRSVVHVPTCSSTWVILHSAIEGSGCTTNVLVRALMWLVQKNDYFMNGLFCTWHNRAPIAMHSYGNPGSSTTKLSRR